MHVIQFIRHENPQAFSIERVFNSVRACIPGDIIVTAHYCRFPSRGVWRRIADAVIAYKHQGDVNHVTGDVHYLTYLLSRRKSILTIHDCEMLSRSTGMKHWLLWYFWFWLPEKRCRIIVAISEETKKQIIRYLRCSPEKIVVIHDPLSDIFSPVPRQFDRVRPRLLQIGTKENKNISRLVEAISGLEVVLVIVGKLTEGISKLLESECIIYENHVGITDQELVDLYVHSDLLTFVSTSEGFGLPIIEAQAIGRAVVTSNLSSMPEVAGMGACLVDPFDVKSIRDGIVRMIEDCKYREDVINMGFSNVERYRAKNIATEYADLYRSVMLGR